MKHTGLLLSLIVTITLNPFLSSPVSAGSGYIEPTLRLSKSNASLKSVALTLDACGGKVDKRILSTLIKHQIPATIFVSGRWIRANAATMAVFKSHPKLFQIENHGRDHRPAIDRASKVYGIVAAGSRAAVQTEVDGGSQAILSATGRKPQWFRGATALYTSSSIKQIEAMGFQVAGYTISADAGAALSAQATQRRILRAVDGDVILAHINQPSKPAGAGFVTGILELKMRGYKFVLLKDVKTVQGH